MFVILLFQEFLDYQPLGNSLWRRRLIQLQIPHQTYKIILVKNLFWRNDEASSWGWELGKVLIPGFLDTVEVCLLGSLVAFASSYQYHMEAMEATREYDADVTNHMFTHGAYVPFMIVLKT